MKRRHFLQGSVALGLSTFADSSVNASNKWSYQFKSVYSSALEPIEMQISGSWPKSIRGNFYRNGPALFQRSGIKYKHWFDGDGMINQYSLSDKGITHQARFVQTKKYRHEHSADRFLYSSAGTPVANGVAVRNNDDLNTANTHVIPFNGSELLALWEGGSAYRVDAKDLSTIGLMTWADELKHIPFSAHPKKDNKGELWNFGFIPYVSPPMVVIYHIGTNGQLKRYQSIALNRPGYMHDFMVTEQYILLLNTSCTYNKERKGSYIEKFTWQQEIPSELIVINKSTLKVDKIIELPPQFVFHFANAEQINKDEIILHESAYNDASIMLSEMQNQNGLSAQHSYGLLTRLRINLKSYQYDLEKTDLYMEFPTWNQAANQIVGVGYNRQLKHGLSSKIVTYNPKKQTYASFDYGTGTITEEPIPINRDGRHYLLHSFYDYKLQQSGIALLDAKQIHNGPIAIARMSRGLPLGFHGSFVF